MSLGTPNIRIEFHRHTTAELAHDIGQLLVSVPWKRNWSANATHEFIKWRYCDLKGGEVLLAYDNDHPVGMITSYTRSYLMNGKVVQLREASDWFCLPEYRQFGLGVRLMGSLMDEEEPLVVIGGNEKAQALLPALGWNRIPHVNTYTLPLTTKWLVSRVWRRLHLPKRLNANGRLRDISGLPAEPPQKLTWCQHLTLLEKMQAVRQPPDGYALTPLLRADELQWLYSAPKGMGSFFCLVFPENKGAEGFVVGRLYCYEDSKYMKLIHLQASSPSTEAYASILVAAVQYALEWKADVAQFRASCPFLQRALDALGLIWSTPTPSYWWAKNVSRPRDNLHLTFLRGDDGIRPYPS